MTDCQSRAVEIEDSFDLWVYNLATKAVLEMVSPLLEAPIYAKDNINGYLSSILAWLGGASQTSGQRVFPGFQIYVLNDYLTDFKLPDKYNTALTAVIVCDPFVQTWRQPDWRGGLENDTLTDSICDSGCGISLSSYFENVQTSCAGYNMSGYPPTIPGGYMYDGWNQTCLKDTATGEYCNGMQRCTTL